MTGPGPDHELEDLITGAEDHEPGTVDWDPPQEIPRPAPANPDTEAPPDNDDPENGHPT